MVAIRTNQLVCSVEPVEPDQASSLMSGLLRRDPVIVLSRTHMCMHSSLRSGARFYPRSRSRSTDPQLGFLQSSQNWPRHPTTSQLGCHHINVQIYGSTQQTTFGSTQQTKMAVIKEPPYLLQSIVDDAIMIAQQTEESWSEVWPQHPRSRPAFPAFNAASGQTRCRCDQR